MDLISTVDINLIIHRDAEDIKIGFPFDMKNDRVEDILAELTETLGLNDSEIESVEASIQQQLAQSRDKMPDADLYAQSPSDDLSDGLDEEIFSDPEYQALLKRQREEIDAMEERHFLQQRELMNSQLSPPTVTNAVDDLIVFS